MIVSTYSGVPYVPPDGGEVGSSGYGGIAGVDTEDVADAERARSMVGRKTVVMVVKAVVLLGRVETRGLRIYLGIAASSAPESRYGAAASGDSGGTDGRW